MCVCTRKMDNLHRCFLTKIILFLKGFKEEDERNKEEKKKSRICNEVLV